MPTARFRSDHDGFRRNGSLIKIKRASVHRSPSKSVLPSSFPSAASRPVSRAFGLRTTTSRSTRSYTFAFFQSVKNGNVVIVSILHLPTFSLKRQLLSLTAGLPLQPAVQRSTSPSLFSCGLRFRREKFSHACSGCSELSFFIFVIAALAIFAFHPGDLHDPPQAFMAHRLRCPFWARIWRGDCCQAARNGGLTNSLAFAPSPPQRRFPMRCLSLNSPSP